MTAYKISFPPISKFKIITRDPKAEKVAIVLFLAFIIKSFHLVL